jgi:hypothetical protein
MIDNERNDQISFMIEPLVLEIYLNKENYKDRLLINDLKKTAQIIKLPEHGASSFFVKASELEGILHTRYYDDILNFDSSSPADFEKSANSIYYIESALREFPKLRYFRVKVSANEKSAKKDSKFEFKIMHSRVDLANSVTPEFLVGCKKIFQDIGVYKPSKFEPKPYFEIQTKDLLILLQNHTLSMEPTEDNHILISDIMSIFSHKLEKDNSTILVIIER